MALLSINKIRISCRIAVLCWASSTALSSPATAETLLYRPNTHNAKIHQSNSADGAYEVRRKQINQAQDLPSPNLLKDIPVTVTRTKDGVKLNNPPSMRGNIPTSLPSLQALKRKKIPQLPYASAPIAEANNEVGGKLSSYKAVTPPPAYIEEDAKQTVAEFKAAPSTPQIHHAIGSAESFAQLAPAAGVDDKNTPLLAISPETAKKAEIALPPPPPPAPALPENSPLPVATRDEGLKTTPENVEEIESVVEPAKVEQPKNEIEEPAAVTQKPTELPVKQVEAPTKVELTKKANESVAETTAAKPEIKETKPEVSPVKPLVASQPEQKKPALPPKQDESKQVYSPLNSEPEPTLSKESKRILNSIPSNIDNPAKKQAGPLNINRTRDTGSISKPENPVISHEAGGIKIQITNRSANLDYELEKAYDALVTGQPTLAIQIYKNILENDPNNKGGLFGLATTYHRSGQLDQARGFYSKLLSVAPSHRDGLNNFLVLLADEAPQEALEQMQKLSKRNPNFSPIQAQMAVIYQRLGDSEHASEHMFKAVSMSPENLVYRYNLAIMLDKQKKYGEAERLYRQLAKAAMRGENIPGSLQKIQQRLTFIGSNRR